VTDRIPEIESETGGTGEPEEKFVLPFPERRTLIVLHNIDGQEDIGARV